MADAKKVARRRLNLRPSFGWGLWFRQTRADTVVGIGQRAVVLRSLLLVPELVCGRSWWWLGEWREQRAEEQRAEKLWGRNVEERRWLRRKKNQILFFCCHLTGRALGALRAHRTVSGALLASSSHSVQCHFSIFRARLLPFSARPTPHRTHSSFHISLRWETIYLFCRPLLGCSSSPLARLFPFPRLCSFSCSCS